MAPHKHYQRYHSEKFKLLSQTTKDNFTASDLIKIVKNNIVNKF